MGKYSKESLEKLLLLIDEICHDDDNLWFKEKLNSNHPIDSSYTLYKNESVDKIYEYCIKDIITKQANKFYQDFKLSEIKEQLVYDFIRMEHFRREDNFEDFCLAMFQQIENIVVYIFESFGLEFKLLENLNQTAISNYDIQQKKFIKAKKGLFLSNLIFQKFKDETPFVPQNNDYFFTNKFRLVSYFFYFNQTIEYNTNKFEEISNLGNYLYQTRNLNHRGGKKSPYQQKILDEIMPNHNKYYFKFLGFLESFTTNINRNL